MVLSEEEQIMRRLGDICEFGGPILILNRKVCCVCCDYIKLIPRADEYKSVYVLVGRHRRVPRC